MIGDGACSINNGAGSIPGTSGDGNPVIAYINGVGGIRMNTGGSVPNTDGVCDTWAIDSITINAGNYGASGCGTANSSPLNADTSNTGNVDNDYAPNSCEGEASGVLTSGDPEANNSTTENPIDNGAHSENPVGISNSWRINNASCNNTIIMVRGGGNRNGNGTSSCVDGIVCTNVPTSNLMPEDTDGTGSIVNFEGNSGVCTDTYAV